MGLGANLSAIDCFLPQPGSLEPMNVPGLMAVMHERVLTPKATPEQIYAGYALMQGLSQPLRLADISRTVESKDVRRQMERWTDVVKAHPEIQAAASQALPWLKQTLEEDGKISPQAEARLQAMFDGSHAKSDGSDSTAVTATITGKEKSWARSFRLQPYRVATTAEITIKKEVPSPYVAGGTVWASGKVALKTAEMATAAEMTMTQCLKAFLNANGFGTTSGRRSKGATLRAGDSVDVKIESRSLGVVVQPDGSKLERWAIELKATAPDGSAGETSSFIALRPVVEGRTDGLPALTPERLVGRAVAFGAGQASLPGLKSIDPAKVRRILYVSAGPDIMTVNRYAASFPLVDEIQFEDYDFGQWKNLPALLALFGIEMTPARYRRLVDKGSLDVTASLAGRPVKLKFRRQDALKTVVEKTPFDLVMMKKPGDYGSLSYASGFWPHVLSRVRHGGFVTIQVASEPRESGDRAVTRVYPAPVAILDEIKGDRIDDVAVYSVR